MSAGTHAPSCTAVEGEISANSDIVGGGAIAAYFATATITLTAILVGYVTDSLDDDLMNDLDRHTIRWCRSMRHGAKKLKNYMLREKQPDRSPGHCHSQPDVKRRRAVMTQFVLTLSDQQLVTGMAILIAGVSQQSRLTMYEFSVVSSLAWFSSTTHLATMDVLRNYLRAHRKVSNCRVAGMAVILSMLMYASWVAGLRSTSNSTVTVQCFFSSYRSAVGGYADLSGVLGLCVRLMTTLIIVYGYAKRIRAIYVADKYSIWWCLAGWYYHRFDPDTKGMKRHEIVKNHREKRRRRRLGLIKTVGFPPLRFWLQGCYLCQDSFMASLTGVAFSFSYGISQTVWLRWLHAPSLTPDSVYWGVGQITALLLLVLPVLAAIETYCDCNDAPDIRVDAKESQRRSSSNNSHDNMNAQERGERQHITSTPEQPKTNRGYQEQPRRVSDIEQGMCSNADRTMRNTTGPGFDIDLSFDSIQGAGSNTLAGQLVSDPRNENPAVEKAEGTVVDRREEDIPTENMMAPGVGVLYTLFSFCVSTGLGVALNMAGTSRHPSVQIVAIAIFGVYLASNIVLYFAESILTFLGYLGIPGIYA